MPQKPTIWGWFIPKKKGDLGSGFLLGFPHEPQVTYISYLVGGVNPWYTYPSEKSWSESQLGFDEIPNINGKS